MNTNKFEQIKNKVILTASNKAVEYLLNKYGSAKLIGEPTVDLVSSVNPVSSDIGFSGTITVFANNGLKEIGLNMTINENDVNVESETTIQSKIENALNDVDDKDHVVSASLDSFKLTDDGSNYLKVSHPALEDAALGVVGKNEYSKSADKSTLLQTVVKDALTRVASEQFSLSFTGEFKEPTIEKVAMEKVASIVEARFYPCEYCADGHHTLCKGVTCECASKKCEEKNSGKKEEKKASWLTADMFEDEMVTVPEGMDMCDQCGKPHNELELKPLGQGMICDTCINKENPTVAIKENMPKATLSNKLNQDMQLEGQQELSANEKIKNNAVNSLISMLQSMGFGSTKIAEVSVSKDGFDIMTTVDANGVIKAVNIPVVVKESSIILPKKQLVSTLIEKGLDINAKLHESFSQELLEKIAQIEELENYKQAEVENILTETHAPVIKEASDSSNTQFLGDTDVLTLNKFLIPNWETLEVGQTVSDGSDSWELVGKESSQLSKGEDDGSQWHFKKVAPPKNDKEPKVQIKI